MRQHLTTSKVVFVALALLLVVLQLQIWIGQGSISNVTKMKAQLQAQTERNTQLQQDIDRLHSEIQDLKEGLSTVEEKARFEMGMVKPNEVFVQITR